MEEMKQVNTMMRRNIIYIRLAFKRENN